MGLVGNILVLTAFGFGGTSTNQPAAGGFGTGFGAAAGGTGAFGATRFGASTTGGTSTFGAGTTGTYTQRNIFLNQTKFGL